MSFLDDRKPVYIRGLKAGNQGQLPIDIKFYLTRRVSVISKQGKDRIPSKNQFGDWGANPIVFDNSSPNAGYGQNLLNLPEMTKLIGSSTSDWNNNCILALNALDAKGLNQVDKAFLLAEAILPKAQQINVPNFTETLNSECPHKDYLDIWNTLGEKYAGIDDQRKSVSDAQRKNQIAAIDDFLDEFSGDLKSGSQPQIFNTLSHYLADSATLEDKKAIMLGQKYVNASKSSSSEIADALSKVKINAVGCLNLPSGSEATNVNVFAGFTDANGKSRLATVNFAFANALKPEVDRQEISLPPNIISKIKISPLEASITEDQRFVAESLLSSKKCDLKGGLKRAAKDAGFPQTDKAVAMAN